VPAGSYTFRVQTATPRGSWSTPGLALEIRILPPFWKSEWFLTGCAAVILLLAWMLHVARVKRLAYQLNLRLEERVSERTRIARELHDNLIQSVTGVALQIGGLSKIVTGPERAKERLQDLRQQVEDCLREARQYVWDIRSPASESIDLVAALSESGEQLTVGKATRFHLAVEGSPRPVSPDLRQQLLRIGREAIGNAARHARATQIEARLRFDAGKICLQISDDGCGFNIDDGARLPGHFGLATMRERAAQIRASIQVSSTVGQGTYIEVIAPTPD
jgi:signal transduction histidine kinase